MVTVLAHADIASFLSGKVEVYEESHGRISFNLSTVRFQKLYDTLRAAGVNPYAAMAWEEI